MSKRSSYWPAPTLGQRIAGAWLHNEPWWPWSWLQQQRWYRQYAEPVLSMGPLRLVLRWRLFSDAFRWDVYVLLKRSLRRCPTCPKRPGRPHKMACYERKLRPLFPSTEGW